jgi:hypothetical protein
VIASLRPASGGNSDHDHFRCEPPRASST